VTVLKCLLECFRGGGGGGGTLGASYIKGVQKERLTRIFKQL
jgi:hypothetical protein